MPRYQYAKPFDIIRTIKDMQQSVKQLQIQSPGYNSVPPNQTDIGTYTLGNVATTNTPLSFAWPIYANDSNPGTLYELEVPLVGTMGAVVHILTLGAQFDASGIVSIVPFGTVIVSAASHGFAGVVKLKMMCMTNGPSGTYNLDMTGGVGDTTLNRGNSPGQAVVYGHNATSLDTTIDHTVSLAGFWDVTSTGETVSGITSSFVRQGP